MPSRSARDRAAKPNFFLQLQQGGLAALDGVPHTLPRNAEVFGNFGQGVIVVIILHHHIALFFRQHIAVKIKQIRDLPFFCHVPCAPFLWDACKAFCFTQALS